MPSIPTSDHFLVCEIISGVFALIAKPEGTAVSNAVIIDLGDRTLVVESLQTPEAGADLLAATKALTGRSAAVLVNTHWHGDHTGSNQLFAGADIVSTPRTVELISANTAADLATLEAEIEGYLDWARKALDQSETDEERRRAERSLRVGSSLHQDLPRFRLTLPTVMLDGEMHLHSRERAAVIATFGGGHTESDVFVRLPGEGVVVTGDLLWTEMHPRADDGDPAAWARILDQIGSLGPSIAVPGHGDVAGRAHLDTLAGYLRELEDLVAAAVADALDDEAIAVLPVPAGSEKWEGHARFVGSVQALAGRRRSGGEG